MNHNLIANFNQGNAMAPLVGHAAAAVQGACHNFTIEWINFMVRDDTVSNASSADRMRRLAARRGAGNPALQRAFTARWAEGGNSYRVADRMMIAMRGLRERELALDYGVFSQTDIVNNVRRPRYEGFIYSFWFNGAVAGAPGGAHTIGFYREVMPQRGQYVQANNYFSAFDPNFGEYYMQAIEFNYWFNRLKLAYGGNFTHHMLKYVSMP